MDAVEFFKNANRLCKNYKSCSACPVWKEGCCIVEVNDDSVKNIEKMISKVEEWAKEHPINTRQSEFLRMFPNAMINESDGILCITPCNIEGKSIGCPNGKSCGDCRREYWLTEVTDNGNVY